MHPRNRENFLGLRKWKRNISFVFRSTAHARNISTDMYNLSSFATALRRIYTDVIV